MELYEDQLHCKNLIVQAIREEHKRIVVSMPTGGGKTVIFCNITKGAVEKGNRVWIVVDSIELIDQTRQTLEKNGINASVIQGNHEDTDYTSQVNVVMSQTITRRWSYFKAYPHNLPDLIILDEVHIQYKAHKEMFNMMPDVIALGFTATPTAKGMGLVYSKLIVASTTLDLVEDNRLVPSKAFACHTPDMKGVKTSQGDYSINDSEEKVNTKLIRGNVVRDYQQKGENRQAICFAVNVKHSVDLADEFARTGMKVAQLDGYTDKELRKQIIDDFKAGNYQILVSVGVLIKGFDAPVDCILDCAPTKSISRHVQKLGRGMRLSNLHNDLLILDFAGNVPRLGHPEDYSPDKLCDGKKGTSKDRKKKEDPLPKACGNCNYMKEPAVYKCPNCGNEPVKPAGIEIIDGKMVEIKKKEKGTKEEKQSFWSSALTMARIKGKSRGWAAHLYRDYFGVWPKSLVDNQYGEITEKAKNFAIHKAIAFAKSKRAA